MFFFIELWRSIFNALRNNPRTRESGNSCPRSPLPSPIAFHHRFFFLPIFFFCAFLFGCLYCLCLRASDNLRKAPVATKMTIARTIAVAAARNFSPAFFVRAVGKRRHATAVRALTAVVTRRSAGKAGDGRTIIIVCVLRASTRTKLPLFVVRIPFLLRSSALSPYTIVAQVATTKIALYF